MGGSAAATRIPRITTAACTTWSRSTAWKVGITSCPRRPGSAAEARVEEARAELETAKLALERSVIKAPFDGVIIAVRSWQGQVILKTLQKDPLIEIAQGERMVARTRVSASDIGKYETQQAAQVLVGDIGDVIEPGPVAVLAAGDGDGIAAVAVEGAHRALVNLKALRIVGRRVDAACILHDAAPPFRVCVSRTW